MHDVQRDGPESGSPFEPTTAGERLGVRPERVVPIVGVPVFDGRHGRDDVVRDGGDGRDTPTEMADLDSAVPSHGPKSEVPWASVRDLPKRVVILAGGVAAAVAAWLLSGDAGDALLSGVVALFLVALQVVDRRVPFSFGQGFVGYRPDMDWPQGVQEEDDVRWDWRPHGVPPGEARRQ